MEEKEKRRDRGMASLEEVSLIAAVMFMCETE